jgi:exonuclease SbcD
MRIMHTADWHIGKQLNNVSLIEDQEYILNQIIKLIEQERPDVLLIAGDIYDRAIPPVEAVELLDRTFSKILLELETPIIAISGNHDNGERLGFASEILKKDKLYIEGNLKAEITRVVLHDEHGPVNFYCIPFFEPPLVREIFDDPEIKTSNDTMSKLMEAIENEVDWNERNVAIFHGFVIGIEQPETSESERTLSVGKAEYISYEHFKSFNYTALGHLHGRQKAGLDTIRYSGTPLKYSFSEVNHKKGIEVVDMDSEGNISTTFHLLTPKRDLQILKGSLDELMSPKFSAAGTSNSIREDYIHAILTDEGELIDPIGKLRSVYPNILSMEREVLQSSEIDSRTSAGKDFKQKTRLELFKDFYESVTGTIFTDEKERVMTKVISELNRAERG